MKGKELQDSIVELARMRGWRCAHFSPGRVGPKNNWITNYAYDSKGFPVLYTYAMPYATAEKRAEYQRGYRQRNAAKRAAGRPDYDRARHANRRAKILGVSGRITVHDVRRILSAGQCFYCGSMEKLRLDHIIPMGRGGKNNPSNIVCACASCNARKWMKESPDTWATGYTACIICNETSRKHSGKGFCDRCYQRNKKASQ